MSRPIGSVPLELAMTVVSPKWTTSPERASTTDVVDTMPHHGEFVRTLPPSSAPLKQAADPAPKFSFNLQHERGHA